MVTRNYNLAGKKIGIFGKGGSGKSTATALLAQTLGERGYEVCILDADSTNIGLHQALGLDRLPVPLMDYFGGTVFRGGLVTCPVDDPTPLCNALIQWNILPKAYYARTQDGIRYLVAGKIGDQGPGAGCDGPVAKIARDLIIKGVSDRAVTLVDFKAGFEDSARGVITGLDWAVVIVDPTHAAIQMAADMKNMVDQIKVGRLPATEHLETPALVAMANSLFQNAAIQGVFPVLNRVTSEQMEAHMARMLETHGLKPLGVIHADVAIAMAWLTGCKIESEQARREVRPIIDELERLVASS